MFHRRCRNDVAGIVGGTIFAAIDAVASRKARGRLYAVMRTAGERSDRYLLGCGFDCVGGRGGGGLTAMHRGKVGNCFGLGHAVDCSGGGGAGRFDCPITTSPPRPVRSWRLSMALTTPLAEDDRYVLPVQQPVPPGFGDETVERRKSRLPLRRRIQPVCCSVIAALPFTEETARALAWSSKCLFCHFQIQAEQTFAAVERPILAMRIAV